MRVAYYAPMKSPYHPRPSGDRLIARLLFKALQSSGHQVELMSNLRSWEGLGDQTAQINIREQSASIAAQIIDDIQARPAERKPDLWFSYHLYHKAPDWIGPAVARAAGIPYVVAEAAYSIDQVNGAWSMGLKQVVHALQQAAAVICLNPRDIPALEKRPESAHKLHRLSPFLDTRDIDLSQRHALKIQLARQYQLDPERPWIVSVAMMRDDAKLESYRHMAQSLREVRQAYQLLLIGDGKARHKVEALYSNDLAPYTSYAGQLDQAQTFQALLASDLFVWPAVNEAIGMAILEAQACGLPVIAGASGAIPEIIINGKTGFLCQPDQHKIMAVNIDQLLDKPTQRQEFSLAAIENIKQRHSLQAAADVINQVLSDVCD